MGMSNKQFVILILSLIAVTAYNGIMMIASSKIGTVWAILSINLLNVCFFLYAMWTSGRMNKGGDEE